jgi:hypothetical protein
MKTEVYSWRVSAELKSDLECEARRRKTTVAAVLNLAAREWLKNSRAANDDTEQQRLHEAAAKCLAAYGGGPYPFPTSLPPAWHA